jgi:hypothetical protein
VGEKSAGGWLLRERADHGAQDARDWAARCAAREWRSGPGVWGLLERTKRRPGERDGAQGVAAARMQVAARTGSGARVGARWASQARQRARTPQTGPRQAGWAGLFSLFYLFSFSLLSFFSFCLDSNSSMIHKLNKYTPNKFINRNLCSSCDATFKNPLLFYFTRLTPTYKIK